MTARWRWLERSAIALCSFALAAGSIALLSGYLAGHDAAAVGAGSSAAGQRFADLGNTRLPSGYPDPPYDSNPPTSGPHVFVPVAHDDSRLNNDQILTALAAGDVIVLYGTSSPPASLRDLAGPFTPAMARTGFAVILARRPGTRGLVALSWTRMLRVSNARDPLLSEFVRERLGVGAPGPSH